MSHRTYTTYTKEFKREAVDLILEQGYSIAEASCNSLDLCKGSLLHVFDG